MENFTQIQINDTRETDVSTPLAPDLHQFTPEQIEEHCGKINAVLPSVDDKFCYLAAVLIDSVQIIRQLQEEVANAQFAADVFETVIDDNQT